MMRKSWQEPFSPRPREGDSIFIGQRISLSWLEGLGTIFKKDCQKPQLLPDSGLYLLHFAWFMA